MKQMQLVMSDDNSFPIEVEEPRIDVNSFLPAEGPIANVNIDISFSSDDSEFKEQK